MRGISRVIIIIIVILIFLIGGFAFYLLQKPKTESFKEIKTGNMKLTSSAFLNNQFIPSKYTCDGENINPPIKIAEVPQGAKSLVLIVDDPDSPTGTWVHWTVWNINPQITGVVQNSVPEGGVEGKTDFGNLGYGGPCPHSGTHHYFFKLYALDVELNLDSSAKKGDVEKAMANHILEEAEIIGLYKR